MSSTPILPAVEAACVAAEAAFDTYRATSREARAAFLERIGDEIMAIGADLIETASRESGLPTARLEGERGRTVGQLKLFASVVRAGLWMGVRIDPALPERTPLPRPDLRLRMIPLGPVAVFGASNFPLAFSTAGGDTASALAAGCPVVVKGHPAHPATGELVAAAIRRAVAACGMPEGVFGHVTGAGNDVGVALVQDPRITAVGFTGSRGGGLALAKLVQSRPVPIPIYAEMSSINPVLLMPAALAARGAALGTAFAQSVTMGVGQFCTNPGLLIAIESEGLEAFVQSASAALTGAAAGQMLTQGIHDAYDKGAEALAGSADVETLARGLEGDRSDFGRAAFFSTTAEAFLANPALGHEVFGPSSILVRCKDEAELKAVIAGAEGQLTATLHMDDGDEALAEAVLPLLERKVGRILVNGWPTGVEVTHAMVHGGPFPATSDARTTSVGTLAIDRFLRPVSYQNFGQALLPPELRDGAADVPKLIDGKPSLG
ncbi:aldehyde dehydrogenase (NADP(+)) [Sphingomonas sp. AP4-R1]|uniref:aldehyde dehydrogenase (NADP(+)) n=1 Tax=Sphingomonas sp. AP4-R1 TaxID=2735134 RepID=UPI0020A35D66|nr:aldehyde dehydrogenase (NADP(+)) [Sphingomonas sp. AP4-R1]